MKHPPGPPMTLGNMRHLGVQRLLASCLNDACRHQGLIDVSKYPDDVEVPSFAGKVICAKCGARGRHIDVRGVDRSVLLSISVYTCWIELLYRTGYQADHCARRSGPVVFS
jgi:hypothetical protein